MFVRLRSRGITRFQKMVCSVAFVLSEGFTGLFSPPYHTSLFDTNIHTWHTQKCRRLFIKQRGLHCVFVNMSSYISHRKNKDMWLIHWFQPHLDYIYNIFKYEILSIYIVYNIQYYIILIYNIQCYIISVYNMHYNISLKQRLNWSIKK